MSLKMPTLGDFFTDPIDALGRLGQGAIDFFSAQDLSDIIAMGGAAAYQLGLFDPIFEKFGLEGFSASAPLFQPVGYQGGIPDLVAVRERVPQEQLAMPTPGGMGQRYFSDTIYAQKPESMMTPPTLEEARATARQQVGLGALTGGTGTGGTQGGNQGGNQASPQPGNNAGNNTGTGNTSTGGGGGGGGGSGSDGRDTQLRAGGGLLALAKGGYYLGGPTDGMADKVPARIDGRQEARLSDGEFVIPADVVSHLGNGNSNAGAQQLYAMMDKVRQDRTGRKQQGKQINPKRYMPGMGA
jgi:hypothetical protein